MMGRSHALSAAGVAALAWAAHGPLGLAEVVIGGATVIGGAMLPDIDHKHSTASNTFGPITQIFCYVANKITGGHRRGTHSIFGALVLGGIAYEGIDLRHGPAAALVIIPLILAWASVVRLFKIPGWLDDLAPVPAALALVIMTSVPLWYVPYALIAGCLIHDAGDLITKVKIPIFWPFSRTGYALNLIKTNGTVERWIIVPASLAAIVYGSWKGMTG